MRRTATENTPAASSNELIVAYPTFWGTMKEVIIILEKPFLIGGLSGAIGGVIIFEIGTSIVESEWGSLSLSCADAAVIGGVQGFCAGDIVAAVYLIFMTARLLLDIDPVPKEGSFQNNMSFEQKTVFALFLCALWMLSLFLLAAQVSGSSYFETSQIEILGATFLLLGVAIITGVAALVAVNRPQPASMDSCCAFLRGGFKASQKNLEYTPESGSQLRAQ